jgi:hypothetical protein
MIDEIRNLAGRLTKGSKRGDGVHLKPADVDVALTALRALASRTVRPVGRADPHFEIELLDAAAWPQQILASAQSEALARAAFNAAVIQRPGRRIRLRRGRKIIETSD